LTDTSPVLAVGAIVIRDRSLLMIQRGRAPNRGRWSIPGGRVETGESLADAVRREVLEETGLEVVVGDLVGILEVPGDPHYVILDYAAAPAGDQEPRAGDDAAAVRWVPFAQVRGLECTPRFVETLEAWGVLTHEEGD